MPCSRPLDFVSEHCFISVAGKKELYFSSHEHPTVTLSVVALVDPGRLSG